jgi:hypothetical protein
VVEEEGEWLGETLLRVERLSVWCFGGDGNIQALFGFLSLGRGVAFVIFVLSFVSLVPCGILP